MLWNRRVANMITWKQLKSSYNSGKAMNYSQMQGIGTALSGKIKWVGCQTNPTLALCALHTQEKYFN